MVASVLLGVDEFELQTVPEALRSRLIVFKSCPAWWNKNFGIIDKNNGTIKKLLYSITTQNLTTP